MNLKYIKALCLANRSGKIIQLIRDNAYLWSSQDYIDVFQVCSGLGYDKANIVNCSKYFNVMTIMYILNNTNNIRDIIVKHEYDIVESKGYRPEKYTIEKLLYTSSYFNDSKDLYVYMKYISQHNKSKNKTGFRDWIINYNCPTIVLYKVNKENKLYGNLLNRRFSKCTTYEYYLKITKEIISLDKNCFKPILKELCQLYKNGKIDRGDAFYNNIICNIIPYTYDKVRNMNVNDEDYKEWIDKLNMLNKCKYSIPYINTDFEKLNDSISNANIALKDISIMLNLIFSDILD
jgi:hypothetical protein